MDLFFTNIAYGATVDSIIKNTEELIINPLIVFIFALALLFFMYGMFEFLMNLESEDKRTIGKSHMIWGIVGMTIMFGVWTILEIVLGTLEIDSSEINVKSGTVNFPAYTPQYGNGSGGTGGAGGTNPPPPPPPPPYVPPANPNNPSGPSTI